MVKSNLKTQIKECQNSSNPNFINSSIYTKKAIDTDKVKTNRLIERLEKQIKNHDVILKEKEEELQDAKNFVDFLLKIEANL
jgi:hypothetical protein